MQRFNCEVIRPLSYQSFREVGDGAEIEET